MPIAAMAAESAVNATAVNFNRRSGSLRWSTSAEIPQAATVRKQRSGPENTRSSGTNTTAPSAAPSRSAAYRRPTASLRRENTPANDSPAAANGSASTGSSAANQYG